MKDKLFKDLKKLSVEDNEKYISYIIQIELNTNAKETKRIYERYKSKDNISLLSEEMNDEYLNLRFEDLNAELKDIRDNLSDICPDDFLELSIDENLEARSTISHIKDILHRLEKGIGLCHSQKK